MVIQEAMNSNKDLNHKRNGFTLLELTATVTIALIVVAIGAPTVVSTLRNLRSSGDTRGVFDTIAVAKMRAASAFTRARVYFDLTANSFHVETWRKTGSPGWVVEGGTQTLSQGVTLGFRSLGSPPPNTQGTISQAPACRDNGGGSIANTACIVFNSRGVPIDSSGAPTGVDAIYVSDGSSVYATTISAMGSIQAWRSDTKAAAWKKQ